MNLLHTIGLMTRAEHEALLHHKILDPVDHETDCDLCKNTRVVQDAVDSHSYPETAPCPKCRDGYWALKAARDWRAKFKRAATDLAAQAEEVAALEKRLNEALCNNGGLAVMVGNLQDEVADLRPDAEAMRKKRAADRKRMAGKRGKDNA